MKSFARSRGFIPLLSKRGVFFPVESFRGTEIFADLAKTISSNENVYKFILPNINGEQAQLYLKGSDTVTNCIDQVTRLSPDAEVKVLAADGAQYGRDTYVDDLMKSPFQLLVSGNQWAIIPPKEVAETRTMINRPDLQQKPATILNRYFASLTVSLKGLDKYDISMEEFKQVCSEAEVTDPAQVEAILDNLRETGEVIFLESHPSINNIIIQVSFYPYRQPAKLERYVREAVDIRKRAAWRLQRVALLADLEAKNQGWSKKAAETRTKSLRYADNVLLLGLGYLGIQAGLISRLVWFDLDWGVMEPVTWVITFSTGILGYAFYALTGKSYEYWTLRELLAHRKDERLKKSLGFSGAEQEKLKADIDLLRREVSAYVGRTAVA